MHILVATDGSERAERAENAAMAVGVELGARLTFLTVLEPDPVLGRRWDGVLRAGVDRAGEARAEKLLTRAETRAWAHGISTDALLVVEREPHRAIMAQAERLGCDMIVMGSRGLGALEGPGGMGSQAGEVLRGSTIPVLIAR